MADPIPGAYGSFAILDELLAERAGVDHSARLAELEAENARLRAENAELKRTVSAVINTVTNPSLKAEAATVVRLAVEVDTQRRAGTGKVGRDGYRFVDTARIGDDWSGKAKEPVTPIRGRATVNRHIHNLADFGLIGHRIDTVEVEMVLPDKQTNQPRRRPVPVKETWIHLPGEGLADMLQPFAHFRREEPSNHGGRRTKAEACQSCGSLDLVTVCRDCGAGLEQIPEPPSDPAPDPSSFHLESALDVKGALPTPSITASHRSLNQDETATRVPLPVVPPEPPGWFDAHGRAP